MPEPVTPAALHFDAAGTPWAPDYGDVYHAALGALPQARHVFLQGNGLPQRWAGRPRWVILETGFGLGNNFLATWAAWRDDPQRCGQLVFISVEKHPLQAADLARVPRDPALQALSAQLQAQWPVLTPNLHTLAFEGGRVRLMLALGDVLAVLPRLHARADAFYLDGFAPARNPQMWQGNVFGQLARLAAPGATAATWSTARVVRDGLAQAGFEVHSAPGFGTKRDMTVARHAPRFRLPQPAAFVHPDHAGEALVIGAGLAGSAAAWTLTQQGWGCTLLEANAQPAQAASGNPAGIFHGIFNAPDSVHAWWHRAAAVHLHRCVQPWLASGEVPGSAAGLLRLEPGLADDEARQRLARVGLPAAYVDWCAAPQAAARAGAAVRSGGWWYAQGGWLAPPRLVQALLGASAPRLRLAAGAAVARIERRAGTWHALGAAGQVLGEAPVLVLACADRAGALLATARFHTEANPGAPASGSPAPAQPHGPSTAGLPADAGIAAALRTSRGQLTLLPAGMPGVCRPQAVLAGQGHAMALPDGRVLVGATSHADDPQPLLRAADQHSNLEQAAALGVLTRGPAPPNLDGLLEGRVCWRCITPDRLPLIGPVPDAAAWHAARAAGHRADALRHVPRRADATGGLYLFTGLGSRGIAHAALGAEVLAAWITGAPMPVEAPLRDAVDPARLALRHMRAARR